MLPEVRVKQDDTRVLRTLLKLLPQHRYGPVPAAVVDENALIGNAERIERRIQPREQGRQHLFFVIDRDDDAELWIRGAHRAHESAATAPCALSSASNSLVLLRMSEPEPRASTLRRIRGSVFEVRKLKRQSLNSYDIPSVRSTFSACAAYCDSIAAMVALASGMR